MSEGKDSDIPGKDYTPLWVNGLLPDDFAKTIFPFYPDREYPANIWRDAPTLGYWKFQINEPDQTIYQMVEREQVIARLAQRGEKAEAEKGMEDPYIKHHLPLEFKIHLQPDRRFTPFVANRFAKLLDNPDVRKLLYLFKVSLRPAGSDNYGQPMPEIVIYPMLGRENAQQLLEVLIAAFKDVEGYGSGKTPRYNTKINNLIFLAQSSGDLKNALGQAGLLDKYFDSDTGYAFIKGEEKHWQNLLPPKMEKALPEISPQEALQRNELISKVAWSLREGLKITGDAQTQEALKIVQDRLKNGETLTQIIFKSAANARSLRNKLGLS